VGNTVKLHFTYNGSLTERSGLSKLSSLQHNASSLQSMVQSQDGGRGTIISVEGNLYGRQTKPGCMAIRNFDTSAGHPLGIDYNTIMTTTMGFL